MPLNHITIFELNLSPIRTNDKFLTILGDDEVGTSDIVALLDALLEELDGVGVYDLSNGEDFGHELRDDDLAGV